MASKSARSTRIRKRWIVFGILSKKTNTYLFMSRFWPSQVAPDICHNHLIGTSAEVPVIVYQAWQSQQIDTMLNHIGPVHHITCIWNQIYQYIMVVLRAHKKMRFYEDSLNNSHTICGATYTSLFLVLNFPRHQNGSVVKGRIKIKTALWGT